MVKIPKILLLTILGLLSADYQPEGGEAFNYTQIYFQWDQIPNAVWYDLSIINGDSGYEYEVETQSNSNLVLNFIQWNSTLSWNVTAISSIIEALPASIAGDVDSKRKLSPSALTKRESPTTLPLALVLASKLVRLVFQEFLKLIR